MYKLPDNFAGFTLYRIYYGDSIVYLGRTMQPLQNRIRGHLFKKPMHREICIEQVSKIEYATFKSQADMNLYEIYFINLWHPGLVTAFCLALFFEARRDYNAELQSFALAGVAIGIAACVFIGTLVFYPQKHCPNCDVVVTTPYCEQCGEQIDATVTCSTCGEKLDTPFCGNCGTAAAR